MTNNKSKEIINYILIGGLTTLINYLVYYVLINSFNINWLISNTISWIFAVIFAYLANRYYVFKSNNNMLDEAWLFILLRIVSLVIENLLLFLFIQILYKNIMISKVVVSIITIILNYILCKQKIFKYEEEEDYYE